MTTSTATTQATVSITNTDWQYFPEILPTRRHSTWSARAFPNMLRDLAKDFYFKSCHGKDLTIDVLTKYIPTGDYYPLPLLRRLQETGLHKLHGKLQLWSFIQSTWDESWYLRTFCRRPLQSIQTVWYVSRLTLCNNLTRSRRTLHWPNFRQSLAGFGQIDLW